jgi:hypothetical protein
MKKAKTVFSKLSQVFFLAGNWFVRSLRLIPGFSKLSLRNQQIAAVIFLLFISSALIIILYPYFTHRYTLSSLEQPLELNLAEYQKSAILMELNELYSFEGNTDHAVIGKIKNVDRLSSRYPFLKKARNGEYLLIMPDFVVVYDAENKQIMDVARVNMLDLKEGDY